MEDETQQQSVQQQEDLYGGAPAESAPAEQGDGSAGAEAAPASAEPLPADASDAYGGPSELANNAAAAPGGDQQGDSAKDPEKKEDDRQEQDEKSVKDIYGTVKNLAKGKGGGIDSLKDAYGEGKDAVK